MPRSPSLTAGEGHDLVGAQRHVAATEQRFNDSLTTTTRAAGWDDSGRPIVDHDVYLVARFQPELPAYLLRDGDLALAGNTHGVRWSGSQSEALGGGSESGLGEHVSQVAAQ